MKIKDGFMLRKVCEEFVVVAVGRQTLDFKGIIRLNDTGAFLWEQLQKECTSEELAAALAAEYAVDEATARADADEFIQSLRAADLLV